MSKSKSCAPDVKPAISIMDAVNEPDIFGPWFRNKESFAAWFCFLKVMFALPLEPAELAIFQKCTGRGTPSLSGISKLPS